MFETMQNWYQRLLKTSYIAKSLSKPLMMHGFLVYRVFPTISMCNSQDGSTYELGLCDLPEEIRT